jgi:hypothetical protein
MASPTPAQVKDGTPTRSVQSENDPDMVDIALYFHVEGGAAPQKPLDADASAQEISSSADSPKQMRSQPPNADISSC